MGDIYQRTLYIGSHRIELDFEQLEYRIGGNVLSHPIMIQAKKVLVLEDGVWYKQPQFTEEYMNMLAEEELLINE